MSARQPTHLSKVNQVVQEKIELPSAFLECMMEAYGTFTPLDPEAPENQMAVNVTFVNQAALNIKRKPQGLKGFEGKNMSELMALVIKVYNNRETPKDRQTQGLVKILSAEDRIRGPTESRKHQLSQLANRQGNNGSREGMSLPQKGSMYIPLGDKPLERKMSLEKEMTRGA